MATTPNFNWSTPDNTGLVKNGALDIRTLGNSIDASLVDLKGGTTGQVLAKASNTDMDFVWAADAGAPTSLGYSAGKNKIINGDFEIWQRGTSFSTGNTYTADRWTVNSNATFTASRQTFTPASAPVAGYEGEYFFRFDKAAGGSYGIVAQRIEDVRTFAGQTVTISFWAKVGSGTLTLNPYVDQNFGTGGSATAGNTTDTVTVNTSWTRYTIQYAVPSMSGKTIGTGSFIEFSIGRVITASACVLDIWGVQVEVGSTATAFQTASGSIQGELALCQRYYWRRTGENNAQDWFSTFGTAYSTTNATVYFQCPQTMRVKPSAVDYANLMIFRIDNGAQIAVTSLAFNNNNPDMTELIAVGGAFLVNFAVVQIKGDGSGVPFIGFSAEL